MNIAESALDNVEDFETNLDFYHSKLSMEKYNGITKDNSFLSSSIFCLLMKP